MTVGATAFFCRRFADESAPTRFCDVGADLSAMRCPSRGQAERRLILFYAAGTAANPNKLMISTTPMNQMIERSKAKSAR